VSLDFSYFMTPLSNRQIFVIIDLFVALLSITAIVIILKDLIGIAYQSRIIEISEFYYTPLISSVWFIFRAYDVLSSKLNFNLVRTKSGNTIFGLLFIILILSARITSISLGYYAENRGYIKCPNISERFGNLRDIVYTIDESKCNSAHINPNY